MKHRWLAVLDRLASLDFQRRFIIKGTPDEFAVPEEVVDDAISVAESTLANMRVSESLDFGLADLMRDFIANAKPHAAAIDFSDLSVTNSELIEFNANWAALRQLADSAARQIRRTMSVSSQDDSDAPRNCDIPI